MFPYFKIFIGLVFLFAAETSFAACTSPAASAGNMQWIPADLKVKYCNGTNWIDTSVSTGATCGGVTAGTINYASSDLRYCNGTNWISMAGASLGTAGATSAGTFQWDGVSKYRVCIGGDWKDSSAPGGCSSFADSTSCHASVCPSCYWDGSVCGPCANAFNQATCSQAPYCTWSTGSNTCADSC